ncbi:hypothetical protein F2Q69_00030635 [Brassica cretica]|uniref:Uncharacterized protein n=1 Tax=Brassica cretica TaxID=69181 RepID=A0A8S9RZA8_BRACR|nr:hypothetical protein F2Q69_00030635 [Brassica cretica]
MAGCMSRTHAGRHHSSTMSGCMTRTHGRHNSSTDMSINMLRLHARRHLVLLHVRLHVQIPCTATPRASGDTQLVRHDKSSRNVTLGLRQTIPNDETTIRPYHRTVQLAERARWIERTVQLARSTSWTERTVQHARSASWIK